MSSRLLIVAGACSALALPASAAAHTGIESRSPGPGRTVSKSVSVVKVNFEGRISDATLVFKCGGTKVSSGDGTLAVRFPDGFYSVLYKKVPGWKIRVVKEKLDQPVERDGLKITEQVARIVWTGSPRKGGIVKPGQFEEFPISTQVPQGEAGSYLTFKAHQTYPTASACAGAAHPSPSTPRRASSW